MFKIISFGTWCYSSNYSGPQQNGRVECKHHHIFNVARALHLQANLPKKFWDEYILTAGYLTNKTPSLLHNKTPFEILHRKTPYSYLRIFSCLAFVHDHDLPKDKLYVWNRPCIFFWFPFRKKGWRFYGLENKK